MDEAKREEPSSPKFGGRGDKSRNSSKKLLTEDIAATAKKQRFISRKQSMKDPQPSLDEQLIMQKRRQSNNAMAGYTPKQMIIWKNQINQS